MPFFVVDAPSHTWFLVHTHPQVYPCMEGWHQRSTVDLTTKIFTHTGRLSPLIFAGLSNGCQAVTSLLILYWRNQYLFWRLGLAERIRIAKELPAKPDHKLPQSSALGGPASGKGAPQTMRTSSFYLHNHRWAQPLCTTVSHLNSSVY